MIDHTPTRPITAGLGIHCDVNSLPECHCPSHGNPHHETWPVPPCVGHLLYMAVTPAQTPCSPLVPLNSAASCGVEGLWQDTKIYLNQLKDIFKTSHAILAMLQLLALFMKLGQCPVPSAFSKSVGSDLPQSIMKPGGLKIPSKILRSFYLGYHHRCKRKRFTQRFLQASSTQDRWKLILSVTDLSSTFLLCCPEDMTYLKG